VKARPRPSRKTEIFGREALGQPVNFNLTGTPPADAPADV
jgi:hypothetical protein